MKILQVIPFFSPSFGGSVTVPYQLSKELAKTDHNITIITSDYGFNKKYAEEIEGFNIKVIPFRTIINFGLFIYTPSIKGWLRDNLNNFDVIHLHNFRSYQNNCVSSCAIKEKIPFIVQAHGAVLPFFEKRNLKRLYDFFWGEKILKGASTLIAVTKAEKDQYIEMGLPEDKIEIIPNGIDVSIYETLPQRGKFRKKYGIEPDEKIILFLGRLHKRKGIDFLIDGFSNLLGQYKNVKLVIVGPDDGFLSNLIRQVKKLQIEDSIIFTGVIPENEKVEAFIDSDLLIYPGTLEIFGLVPFEAIMCGTPVIVCDDCGCGEIIKEANCGYLVKFGDVNNLKEKMKLALQNTGYNKKLVENGKRFIEENLTWKKVGKTVDNLYKNSIQNKNK